MTMMSNTTKTTAAAAAAHKGDRKSASLPSETVEYLKSWMMSPEHVAHPYPTEQEKAKIMSETGIELKRLTNWFVNNRKRFWKPRVEAKLQKCLPPAGVGGAGGCGLSNSVRPKPQGAKSFPTLPNNASSRSAPLHAQGGIGDGGDGLAAPHNHSKFCSAGGAVRAANRTHRENDPHTVSDGSVSSTCSSGGDSISASSSCMRTTLVATSSKFLDSRLAAAGRSTASTVGSSLSCGGYRRHEEVDVHVLRPEGSTDGESEFLPTLSNLTIKSSVPKKCILATFKCPISYTVPYGIKHDREKVQSQRDDEILRVKKHYLNLYLATKGIHTVSSLVGNGDRCPLSASFVSASATSFSTGTPTSHALAPFNTTSAANALTYSSRSRSFTCADLDRGKDNSNPTTRKRARTVSGPLVTGEDEWRNLCQNAESVFCESLPGLEEATRMFGYDSQ